MKSSTVVSNSEGRIVWRRFLAGPPLFFLATAALLVLSLGLWRLVLLVRNWSAAVDIPVATLLESFVIGARFDFRIVSAILLPLFLIGSLPHINVVRCRVMRRVILATVSALTLTMFLLHLVDLEFFSFFNTRLNGSVLLWSDTPGDVLWMVWDSYPVVWYLILYAVISAAFILLLRLFWRYVAAHHRFAPVWVHLLWESTVVLIFVVGIAGRVYEVAPFRWGLAYFSEYDLANQLAINPVHTFVRDVFYDVHKRSHLKELVMDISEPGAEQRVRRMLGVPDTLAGTDRLVRPVWFDPPNADPPSVVVIIMESFGSSLIGCISSEYPYDLTPGFDSMAERSLLFTNFYSAGTHTCSGLFNTLTGSPHLFGKTMMKQVRGHNYFWSLPAILREQGYETLFFTTQDPQFDNMQGFVRANGVMEVYGVFAYDGAEVMSWLGVPDHVMFDYAYDKLLDISRSGRRFCTTLLTGSHHGPWFIPNDAPIDRIPEDEDRAHEFNSLRYADWALARFVSRMAHESAFSNVLIVITSDNGYKYNVTTDLDLSLLEVPLLLYHTGGKLGPGRRIDRLGSQLDILPTVMGQVRLDYNDYSFGVDLLDSTAAVEDFVLSTRWHEVGYIQDGYYLIMRLDGGPTSLFSLADKAIDLAASKPDLVADFTRRASAVYQTAYYSYQSPLFGASVDSAK